MKALYSTEPLKEIEISGTSLEWNAFALAVEQDGSIVPCENVASTAPYAHAARTIQVLHKKNSKVAFHVTSENEIILEGDPTLLENISGTATNFGNDFRKGNHIHIDFQGEDHYIDEHSISTIFMHEG